MAILLNGAIRLWDVYISQVHPTIVRRSCCSCHIGLVRCLLFPCCCPLGFGFTTAPGSARCPAPATIAAVAAVPVVGGGMDIDMTIEGTETEEDTNHRSGV